MVTKEYDKKAWIQLLESETWIFDLDNTLYPQKCNLFAQIDKKMGNFIERHLQLDPVEAKTLQKQYFLDHGTTLNGLMLNHEIDAKDFLDFVHDIDYSPVLRDERLDKALSELPGRKVIFTNGTVSHAESTLEQLGILNHFPEIFDIVASDFVPKPNAAPYDKLLKTMDIDPKKAVMVEDMAKNLIYPSEIGMKTVWVQTTEDWSSMGSEGGHIDHITNDLSEWLHGLVHHEYDL